MKAAQAPVLPGTTLNPYALRKGGTPGCLFAICLLLASSYRDAYLLFAHLNGADSYAQLHSLLHLHCNGMNIYS